MHGQGCFTWPDGRKYEGAYNMDQKHGYGSYFWPDGTYYQGYWVDGKQQGEGSYCTPKNSPRKGIWSQGKFVKWIDNTQSTTKSEGINDEFHQ